MTTSTEPLVTSSPPPVPGDRVVVRFRKGEGAPGDWRRDPSATASDVTGVLVWAEEAALIIARDDQQVRIPSELVLSVRVLSDKPVRNSEIRSLEIAAARGWPGTEYEMIGGWMARAGGGYSNRANSAVPLEFGATLDADSASALRTWYAARDLPATIAAVERLIPARHVAARHRHTETVVMVRHGGDRASATYSVDPVTGVVHLPIGVTVDDAPSDAWVAAVLAERSTPTPTDIGRAVLTASIDGTVGFASVVDGDGPVAVGRGAVTSDPTGTPWLGISCLWTAPRARRRGIGTAVIDELVAWGAGFDARQAYLQVTVDNTAAIGLYRGLGFTRHHTYGYLTL